MTATTIARSDVGAARITQAGVIQSEWIKLRSLRSTWFSLLAAVVSSSVSGRCSAPSCAIAWTKGTAQAAQIAWMRRR